jgi:C-terminal peptidase prc
MAPRRLIVAILLVLLGLLACSPGGGGEMDEMVSVGTHRLHVHCMGEGRPTVVIDTGVGDTSARWASIQAELAQVTRTCVYDRAGYGASEPGPLPRHSERAADELKLLLKNAGVRGPYVLVGHSLGGLNAQVFADRYPEQVAGLVLLDPSPLDFITGQVYPELYQMLEQQAAELQRAAEAARRATDAEGQAKANYLEAVASEHAALVSESAGQVAAIASFGDLPLVVIGSGVPNPAFGEQAAAFQQFWIEQNRALAGKSTNGTFVLASLSGHYLHEDAPELVMDVIRQVVAGREVQVGAYLEVFEIVWQTINDRYYDPTFGGLDWRATGDRYRPLIAAVYDDESAYGTINKMLFELNVSHIGVIPPDEKEQLEPVLAAEGSVGIDVRLLDGEAVIASVRPGSPGAQAGLRPGLIVERVNGKTVEEWADEVWPIPPLHERNERKRLTAKLQEQLYGPLDTTVDLVYLDPDGEAHELALQRAQREGKVILGDEFPPFYVEFESRWLDEEIGYIRLNAFLPTVDSRFTEALASLRDARGLIIDLRGNHGGVFPVRKGMAEQLVQEQTLFWSYKERDSVREVYLEPAGNAYGGPLVVIIDVMSASSAEEFSGALQAIGRAVVVGERSAGICLVANTVELPNGAVLMYPFGETRTADGTVLEGRGVIPDIEVSLDHAALSEGQDPQLEAAIQAVREAYSENGES